jgi:uncharacterized protein
MPIPILAVSDEVDPRVHSVTARDRLGHVKLAIGCGDVPPSYLEFITDALRKPVYYVHGNHVDGLANGCRPDARHQPQGAIDLAGRVVRDPGTGLILAGIPGSPRYCDGAGGQYDEWQIKVMIARMLPQLLWNKAHAGRALDVLVTHAPPRGVNDRDDPAHQGYEVLRSFLERFQPAYLLHGHIHLYDRSQPYRQRFAETDVINVFPFRVLEVEPARGAAGAQPLPRRESQPLVDRAG